MERPRYRHVAELAGVSEATVSRVVNGRSGVGEQTRREVLSALEQLGYEPSRGRQRASTGLVGLIIPELTNPVFPLFAQAIESRLAARGQTTVLCTATPSGMSEPEELQALLEHGVDGVVVVSGLNANSEHDHAPYRDLRTRGVPLVVVNGRPPDLDVASVGCDHRDASTQGVRHLLALGHRRLGLAIGPTRYFPARERVEGFLETGRELGIDDEDLLVRESVYGVDGGHAAALELLGQGATGLLCGSDLMALGAYRAAAQLGVPVPDRLSVIGFDDAGPWEWTDPPLTSFRQPVEEIAAHVVRLLEQQAEDGPCDDEVLLRGELVVRASTAPVVLPTPTA